MLSPKSNSCASSLPILSKLKSSVLSVLSKLKSSDASKLKSSLESALATSLDEFGRVYRNRISESFIIHPKNLSVADGIVKIPPYMIFAAF